MTFEEICRSVLANCPDGYAKAYAQAGLENMHWFNEKDTKVQCLYILTNIHHWRGDEANRVRAALKQATSVTKDNGTSSHQQGGLP